MKGEQLLCDYLLVFTTLCHKSSFYNVSLSLSIYIRIHCTCPWAVDKSPLQKKIRYNEEERKKNSACFVSSKPKTYSRLCSFYK